jgi:hypothetical protein
LAGLLATDKLLKRNDSGAFRAPGATTTGGCNRRHRGGDMTSAEMTAVPGISDAVHRAQLRRAVIAS